MGHKDRQALKDLIGKPRQIKILADMKKTSVKEMADEYKTSEGSQLLLNGGSFTVPVIDFIKPNHKSAQSTEIGKNLLCAVPRRMVGPGSGLYVNLRAPGDVKFLEEKQLKKEMQDKTRPD